MDQARQPVSRRGDTSFFEREEGQRKFTVRKVQQHIDNIKYKQPKGGNIYKDAPAFAPSKHIFNKNDKSELHYLLG